MGFSDSFFKRVEKKTNVDKNTILDLANKLQNGNMKDETTLKEVINTLSQMTGKKVTKEQEEKIINTVMNDNVPANIDKYYS
jgi:hypothetical protein